jgi:hypothetical protein
MKFRKFIWLTGMILSAALISACNIGTTPPPEQDMELIQTQAVELVLTQAALQQTQTALAVPPPTETPIPTSTLAEIPTIALGADTPTPFAFNTQPAGFTPLALATPTPTIGVVNTVTTRNGCNDAAYIGEGGSRDGDIIEAGKPFQKSFQLLNTGECTWDEGYSFAFIPEFSTPGFQGYDIVLKKNAPEEYTKPGHGQTYVLKLFAPKTPGTYKGYWKLKDDAGNPFGPLVWLEIVVK